LSEFSGLNSPDIGEKCAVFAAYNIENAAEVTAVALHAMQHRGQEATGIATVDGGRVWRYGAAGMVKDVYVDGVLDQLPGRTSVGHNRYSTSGGIGGDHVQPTVENFGRMAYAHNGNLALTAGLRTFLENHGIPTHQLNDSGMMGRSLGYFAARGALMSEAVHEAYPHFGGAFSSVAATQEGIGAFCDQCKIRPLSVGLLDDGYVVASETVAFDAIGAEFVRDVKPGELVVINKDGLQSHQITQPDPHFDLFELVYFAHEESLFKGQPIRDIRYRMGQLLARQQQLSADIVISVPSSANPAAAGYAEASGIPFAEGLVRNPDYIKRTFIEPTPEARAEGVRRKLSPTPEVRGKELIVVDDSMVRGNTNRAIVRMLRDAGALAVHVVLASPPVKYPDFYGTDIPDQRQLIANQMDIAGMCRYIDADSIGFASLPDTIAATSQPAQTFSASCFDGKYPIPIGSLDATVRRDRHSVSLSHRRKRTVIV